METNLNADGHITCKNCDNQFQGNFCNNCGQTAHTHAINWHYVIHEVQHGVFHVDKGILYTSRQLFTRPGNAIRDFIEGRRVKHFKPVAMVFLLGTIYGVLYHYLELNLLRMQDTESTESTKKMLEGINEWMSSHYALFVLIAIPLFAVGSFLVFRKRGYNFIEHMVLNCFVAAQKIILQLFLLPFVYIYANTPNIIIISVITALSDFCLTFWVYSTFFKQYSRINSFFKTILSYLIFYILMFLIMIIGVIVFLANEG